MPFHISPDYAPSHSDVFLEPDQINSKYTRFEEPRWQQPFVERRHWKEEKGKVTQTKVVYCVNCGTAAYLPAIFCKNCGVKLTNPGSSMDRRVVWLSSAALTLVFIMAIALRVNDSTREAWATFIGLSFLAAFIALAFFTWRRILGQAGYPSWLAIFMPIPLVSGIALLYMGYNEWPISRKARELEAECLFLRSKLEMNTTDGSVHGSQKIMTCMLDDQSR